MIRTIAWEFTCMWQARERSPITTCSLLFHVYINLRYS